MKQLARIVATLALAALAAACASDGGTEAGDGEVTDVAGDAHTVTDTERSGRDGDVVSRVDAAPISDVVGADAPPPVPDGAADSEGPGDGEGPGDSEGPADAAGPFDVGDAAAIDVAPADAGRDTGPPPPWRSALYPEDWTPAFTDAEGRYLPDFSYAGYRNGEAALAQDVPALVLDVTAPPFGADATGESDATAAIQAAIDEAAAAGGAVVHVPAGLYRVDGALRVTASRIVLRGDGPAATRLWFTASEGRSHRAHVQIHGALSSDLDVPLAADVDAREVAVLVEDAGDLAPGDDVTIGQVITDAFVADHGMTGTWQAFNGQWHPLYWRTVVAVDRTTTPHRVTLDVPIRYPLLLRDDARLQRQRGTIAEVGVESLGVADAVGWEQAWAEDQVHVIELAGVEDAWVRDVASFRSPGAPDEGDGSEDHVQSGGIIVRRSKRVTIADVTFEEAQNRGGGGNGYLFEVRVSSEVLFRACVGRAGRHNFIQNWGFGATGIVWLRIRSEEGRALPSRDASIAPVGFSEFHHSLATANLIDSAWIGDGWGAVNREDWSSGAGHTATRSVVWNAQGTGVVNSLQFGWGYVIGTAPGITVFTQPFLPGGAGTEPEDWTEGLGAGATLDPPSLYEDQLARRLARER